MPKLTRRRRHLPQSVVSLSREEETFHLARRDHTEALCDDTNILTLERGDFLKRGRLALIVVVVTTTPQPANWSKVVSNESDASAQLAAGVFRTHAIILYPLQT